VTLLAAITIKLSLVVAAGLCAAALLRARSAALRHWVLAVALGCAAAIPALESIVPAWQLPQPRTPVVDAVLPLAAGDFTIDSVPPIRSTAARPSRIDRMRALALPAWIVGAALSLCALLVGVGRLAWIAAAAIPLDDPRWTTVAHDVARRYGIRRRVVLLASSHPALLLTWGVLRPRILVPVSARTWTDARIRVVLGHELAHVRRGDWLVQIAAEIVRAIYWFNPLVWIACRRLREESERACDDAVIGLGVQGEDYASHLLDLARTFRRHRRLLVPAPAIAHQSSLERRIVAMLNAHLNRTPLGRPASAAVVLAVALLAVPIAGFARGGQPGTASFSGTALDTLGKILPDAALALVNAQTGEKYETTSDGEGRFAFKGVAAGDYVLNARMPGFALPQYKVSLQAGADVRRDVTLQLGSVSETITVSATDEGRTAVQRGPRAPASYPDEPDPCAQSTVGGCIHPPLKLHDVRPIYPERLRGSRTEGRVVVEGRLGVDGYVKDLRVVAPAEPELAASTLEAVSGWQFSATRLDGVPMEIGIRITVNFVATRD